MMKLFVNRFLILGLVLFALSCSKEESIEGATLTPGVGRDQWSFLDSNKTVRGPIDTAFKVGLGNLQSAIFAGPSDDGTGVIYLQIAGADIVPGTYTTENVLFEYYVNGAIVYENVSSSDGAFTVVVTEVDSAGYRGTFSGQVYDRQGEIKTIRDGKFDASLSEDSAPEVGEVTIWSRQLCTPPANIEIQILNQKRFISQAFTDQPTTCNVNGAANFTLPAGTYPVTVICGGDTAVLSLDVEANVCNIAELQ